MLYMFLIIMIYILLGSPEKDSFEDELIILDSDEGAESMGGSYSSDIDSDADGCGWIIPDEGVVINDDTLQEYCVRPMM